MSESAPEPGALVIVLGPYRNLSTLTATALAFHPQVQILNHAARRLLDGDGDIDFLASPDVATYRRFLTQALDASRDGAAGLHGGSILHSHAFEDRRVRRLYAQRFGDARMKARPDVLVWKDSVELQRRLAAREDTLPTLIERLPNVRFLLPIRQPLRCAESNLRTGHSRYLMDAPAPSLEDVLDAVLASLVWVLEQRDRWPDRFMAVTEHRDTRTVAADLARYLGVANDPAWTTDFQSVFRVRPGRRFSSRTIAMAQAKIAAALSRWPDIHNALRA